MDDAEQLMPEPAWHRLRHGRWQVPNRHQLVREEWKTMGLLFNPLSALTHQLQPPALAVLDELDRQPATARELLQRLEADDPTEAMLPAMVRLLWELDELGLIAPVAP